MNTPAGEVVGIDFHRRTADRRQAEYYRSLLDSRRSQVDEELAAHSAMLERHQHAGDLDEVRRARRLMRAKQTELLTIERLIDAIDIRFGPPRR